MSKTKNPSLLLSICPLFFLIFLLVINIYVFKDNATSGPNQLALFASGVFTTVLGIFFLKVPYREIEKSVTQSISMAIQPMIVLLVVGALVSSWIMSGVVPMMIYYGLKMMNASIFLPLSCVLCSMVAVATGSSWSTTGTIGVALMGIGTALGLPVGAVAGSIISGAYFGDKLSPLSDTTNLASAMAGANLFDHIKHMLYTTVPAMALSLVGFSILGFYYGSVSVSTDEISAICYVIEKNFYIGLPLLLIPAVVLFLVTKKMPALPALVIGVMLGVIGTLIFQRPLISLLASHSGTELGHLENYYIITQALYEGLSVKSGHTLVDSLLSRGGMVGMLNTIWLVFTAMIFGGTMDGTRMLEKLASSILSFVTSVGGLVGATLGSCILMNLTASDQYLAIVVPGRMFRRTYEKFKLHPKNLSRALEDSGTVTSVLVPWNSGGAYNSSVLGVATLTYLPFCFFNLLSPIVSLFLASMDLTLERTLRGVNPNTEEIVAT